MRFLKKFTVIALTLLITLNFVSLVYAGDALRKLGRGISNAALGWSEVFYEIGRETKKSGDIAGFFVGPIKGVFKALGRTLVGAYETVTFLIPIPSRYEPLIEPEFIFEQEE